MSDRPGEYQTSQPFEYVVGGSLPLDAVSYVKRSADDEFFAGLKAGKFCYVLNSRQMGKSSLRVRTMARLQADGVVCVSIDMTAIGSAEVTAEQWYLGVLWAIVKQVREQTTTLADWKLPALRSWWVEREGLSFVQRWGEFIEVLLGEVGERVVIFVDEIDSVLGLGFRADDFFAAIRECYDRRVDQPQYDRLTFALLGVCAPQDLIQDKRRTPFNIGQAIELSGFTEEEAKGLPGGEETLREVLGWTGGQPFLTQRVCRLVREEMLHNPQFWGDMSVDEIVQSRIVRVWESQDEQVHFQTIGDRMMADESLAGAMLGMYQRVLAEGGVGIDGSEEQIALRLTGVVVKWGDRLCVMNRIYEGVFGSEWVSGKLAALRPYGEELRSWLESADEAWLLRGDSLEKAKVWANELNRKLAPDDYQFLTASQELEQQDDRDAKVEAECKLAVADRRNKKSLFGAGLALAFVAIAVPSSIKAGIDRDNAQKEVQKAQQDKSKLGTEKSTLNSNLRSIQQKEKEAQNKALISIKQITQAQQNLTEAQQKEADANQQMQVALVAAQTARQKEQQASQQARAAQGQSAVVEGTIQQANQKLTVANQKITAANVQLQTAQQQAASADQMTQAAQGRTTRAIEEQRKAQEQVRIFSSELQELQAQAKVANSILIISTRVAKLKASLPNFSVFIKTYENELITSEFTISGTDKNRSPIDSYSKAYLLPKVTTGQSLKVSVDNQETRDLSISILFLSTDGEILILPFTPIVPAGATIQVPGDQARIMISKPLGIAQCWILATTKSIKAELEPLAVLMTREKSDPRNRVENSLAAVMSILDSLEASHDKEWTILPIMFEVVDYANRLR